MWAAADLSSAEFFRHLGLFENWAATYISMNFVSGMPDTEVSDSQKQSN